MAEVIDGRRGGKLLANASYLYQRNKVRENVMYWRCSECHSTLRTEFFDVNEPPEEIQVENAGNHNHLPMDETISKQKITSRFKAKVAENPSAPIRRLYDTAVADEERNGLPLDDIPTFHRIESQLKRVKYSNILEIPNDVDDVVIEDEWSQTWQGRNNLIHQDNDWEIVIFGTDRNLRLLRRGDTIFADVTFRTCPHPYNQIFTIHVKIRDHVTCAVTCLMLNRDIGSYREILRILKEMVRYVNRRRWSPTSFCPRKFVRLK